MRRLVLSGFILLVSFVTFAQKDTTVTTTVRKVSVAGLPRANDHFMFQVGYLGWQGKTTDMHTSGLPRTFNAYFLFDFPFKTNPHLSVAIGPGIATDNMYFSKTSIGIKDVTPTLQFRDLTDSNHFKKYKLNTAYLEAPLELRFTADPENNGKSFKVALGAKVGTLLSAHTKGKTLLSSAGTTLGTYIEKENDKNYFNSTRLSATARIGYGHFSLYGAYQINTFFKDAVAPAIHPFNIGLTLSGL